MKNNQNPHPDDKYAKEKLTLQNFPSDFTRLQQFCKQTDPLSDSQMESLFENQAFTDDENIEMLTSEIAKENLDGSESKINAVDNEQEEKGQFTCAIS